MHDKVTIKKAKGGFSLKIQTAEFHSIVVGVTTAQATSLTKQLLKRLPSQESKGK